SQRPVPGSLTRTTTSSGGLPGSVMPISRSSATARGAPRSPPRPFPAPRGRREVLGEVARVELGEGRRRGLRAEDVAADRVDLLLEGADDLGGGEEGEEPNRHGPVRVDVVVDPGRKDEELPGLQLVCPADREDLPVAFGDEHDLLDVV